MPTAREKVATNGYGSVEDQFSAAVPVSNKATLVTESPQTSTGKSNDRPEVNRTTNWRNETVIDIGESIDADDVYSDSSYEVVNIGPDLDADQP